MTKRVMIGSFNDQIYTTLGSHTFFKPPLKDIFSKTKYEVWNMNMKKEKPFLNIKKSLKKENNWGTLAQVLYKCLSPIRVLEKRYLSNSLSLKGAKKRRK